MKSHQEALTSMTYYFWRDIRFQKQMHLKMDILKAPRTFIYILMQLNKLNQKHCKEAV